SQVRLKLFTAVLRLFVILMVPLYVVAFTGVMVYCTEHAGFAGRSSSAVRKTLSWMFAAVVESVLRPISWPSVVRKSIPYVLLMLFSVPRSFSKKKRSPSRRAVNCFCQIARLVGPSDEPGTCGSE